MIRKKIISGIIILAIIFTIPSGVLFANGYLLSGVGAKALGMAGAYHAIADDWSAMYWNPAGLIGQKPSVNVTAKVIIPVSYLLPNVTADDNGYIDYSNTERIVTAHNYLETGSISAIYRFNRSYTAGISIFSPAYRTTEWLNLFSGPPEDYGNTEPYPKRAWYSEMKVFDIHPTIAFKFDDKLDFGLGISMQWGSLTMESPNVKWAIPKYPWPQVYIDETLEGSGIGFGINLGAKYKLTREMCVGLSLRSPINIKIDGDLSQKLIVPLIPGVEGADGGHINTKSGAQINLLFPSEVAIGVAYQPIRAMTVAFDFDWTQWSTVQKMILIMDHGSKGPRNEILKDRIIPMVYNDSYKFSFGAEAKFPGGFIVRGGYFFETTPVPDETRRPILNDNGDNHNISFGFRFNLNKKMHIDGYWEHTQATARTITSADIAGDNRWDNVGGEWNHKINTVGLSLNYEY